MKPTDKLEDKINSNNTTEEKKVMELSDESLENATGGGRTPGNSTLPSGFKCPVCNEFIQVSMFELTFRQSIYCPVCRTAFSFSEKRTHLPDIDSLIRNE